MYYIFIKKADLIIERQRRGNGLKDNIVMIGFMGCGKTTVGKRLAKELEYAFLDMDLFIEEEEKMTIRQIFENKGESYFRRLETESLKKILEQTKHTIFSTGGGLPLREENAKLLQKLGFVVYLRVKKETVLERLKDDRTRPLLDCDDPAQKVEELLNYRDPIYEVGAHLVIDVDGKTVSEIIDEVVRNYKMINKQNFEL